MYTNAEYLEARFDLSTRVVSALVQALYRTPVLGMIATTLYLALSIVGGWGASAWWGVVAIAALATTYTAFIGLRSVAVTDALQSLVMIASSTAVFLAAWAAVGGWSGMETRLDAPRHGLGEELPRVGSDDVSRQPVAGESQNAIDRRLLLGGTHDHESAEIVNVTPSWLAALAWIMIGLGYAVVNHT